VVALDNPKHGIHKDKVYYDKEYKHLKNVFFFAIRHSLFVLQQVHGALVGVKKIDGREYNFIHFFVFQNRCSMCDFSSSRFKLEHLTLKHLPQKHWCESFDGGRWLIICTCLFCFLLLQCLLSYIYILVC